MAIITKAQLEQASIDAELLNKFRKGTSDETIPTDEGLKPTVAGIVKQALEGASIDTMDGFSFTTGATIFFNNQALLDNTSGLYYRWSGAINGSGLAVPANSSPSSAGGIGPGKWLNIADGDLRSQLKSEEGASFPNYGKAPLAKSLNKTVKFYGASGDGVTDDSPSFSFAAQSIEAVDITPTQYKGVPHAPYCEIYVPAGTYNLSSLVDTNGKNVVWIASTGALFINPENLNGKLLRNGVKSNNGFQYGTLDSACSFSVSANRGIEAPAQVLGVTAPNQLAVYIDRDSVGFHAENYAPALTASVNSASYTTTTATLSAALTANQLKKLRVGMVIDTKHTPTKYTGVLTGWAANGTSITVEGWYLADGVSTTHDKVTPPNGTGLNINPFTKAWAMNANVFMDLNSHAIAAVGLELGISNEKFDYDPATDTWHTWCYDAITLGSKRCETAYMQRGYYYKGYESRGATGYAFTAKNANGIWAGNAVYHSQMNSDYQILVQPDLYGNKTSFAVKKDGSMEIGRTDAAASVTLDFHSSGNDIDYDARITASGGSATVGSGVLTLTASSINLSPGFVVESPSLRPSADATKMLGLAQYRFNTIYASTGTINTSDVTKKVFIDINEAELKSALEIKSMMRKFQFKDAIANKGADEARYHFGVGAQYIRDVLIKNGLDAEKYAFFCHDKWEDEYEDILEEFEETKEVEMYKDIPVIIDGKTVSYKTQIETYKIKVTSTRPTGKKRLVKKAGEGYGIRYDELICFIISAL